MDYPVFIGGRPAGCLTESAEGLYTLLRADCEAREGMIRLWAHGGGKSVCLGLLAPQGGRLRLTRRLTRRERAALPSPIERVDDRRDYAAPEKAPTKPPKPRPSAPPAKEPGWRALPDGSLLGPDGAQAIPASLPPSSPLAPLLQQINGRDYLVFRR